MSSSTNISIVIDCFVQIVSSNFSSEMDCLFVHTACRCALRSAECTAAMRHYASLGSKPVHQVLAS
jgi:hypothetical protein